MACRADHVEEHGPAGCRLLLEEAAIEDAELLRLTHETIANHLGTHREVVTRMLRYFQDEGMVRLARGSVELLDKKRLEALRDT